MRTAVLPAPHDRIGHVTLPLTHEFLSLMLRRAGVTTALNALRKSGLISYHRDKSSFFAGRD
jgi:hypothetical protein